VQHPREEVEIFEMSWEIFMVQEAESVIVSIPAVPSTAFLSYVFTETLN
jgi:hypothetical protein